MWLFPVESYWIELSIDLKSILLTYNLNWKGAFSQGKRRVLRPKIYMEIFCTNSGLKKMILVFWISIFFFTCKTNSIQNTPPLFESTQNPNMIFFFGEFFKRKSFIFDSQKISFHRNKKDLTNLLLLSINQNDRYFCEGLPKGFHRFDFKFFLNKRVHWKGRESISLKESGFLNTSKSHLLFMESQESYLLYPKLSEETRWDVPNSILHFYMFPLFPLGFYPYYERSMEIKFLPIPTRENVVLFRECCSSFGKKLACESQIQRIITDYGEPYGYTSSTN